MATNDTHQTIVTLQILKYIANLVVIGLFYFLFWPSIDKWVMALIGSIR